MPRRSLALLVVLMLLAWDPAAVRAEDPPEPVTQETFDVRLGKIRGHCRRGRCKRGLSELKELLETHQEKPWTGGRKAELVDLVRRLAFGAKFPPPDPDTLVAGELRSYNPRTGRINIRYTPKQMDDWIRKSGVLVFPARMSGPFTVKIKGKKYPEENRDSFVFVMGDEDDKKSGKTQLYQIVFGSPTRIEGRRKTWLPPKLVRHDGDDKRESSKVKEMPLARGARFELEVKATSTRITAKVNRRLIAESKKPKNLYGAIAFQGKGFDEIKIDGEVETAWIQGMLDQIAEGHRDAFEADFDPADHLPAWVLDGPSRAPTGTRKPMPRHPAGLDDIQTRIFDTTYALLGLGADLDVIERLPELLSQGLPEGAAAYLSAHAQLMRYDLEPSRTSITRCRAVMRDFARARLFEGVVLSLLDRDAEAKPLLDGVLSTYEPDEAFYQDIAVSLMRHGRPAAARKITALATRHGIKSGSLDLLNEALLKAVNGPDWRRVYDVKTKNYHVLTDIDRKTARAAADMLEAMNRLYQSSMEKIGRDETRLFKVYLFSGHAGFMGYLGDLRMFWGAASARAAGVYSPLLKQLLIWNLPSRDEMLKTVRHEGFHQFFDRYLPHAPTWFNEGLAEYYENSEKYAGKRRAGLVAYPHVRLLNKQGLMPLAELFALKGKAYYDRAPHSYAQSWLLVHMLRKGPPKARAAYKRLIDGLEQGSATKATAAAFPPQAIKALESALLTYLSNMPDGR